MTAANRSLATAPWRARFASGLLPPSYTTTGDVTDLNDKDILSQFGRSRFIPASNDQYRQIEEVLRQKPSNLQTAPVTASKQ